MATAKGEVHKKQSPPKGESITIRVSPKIKWGVELLSRKQHRSVTSVVEWALDKALKLEDEGLCSYDQNGQLVENILEEVWDPDIVYRLINLACGYQYLMTYEEEMLWKGMIRRGDLFWSIPSLEYPSIESRIKSKGRDFVIRFLRIDVVTTFWNDLMDVATGNNFDTSLWKRIEEFINDRNDTYIETASCYWNYVGICPPGYSSSNVLTEDDIPF